MGMSIKPELFANLVPLNSLSEGSLRVVASSAELRKYAPGQILFSAGDKDNTLFYLIEGEILRHEANGLTRRMSSDEDNARYALARTKPRLFTAEAATWVSVLCIDEESLEQNLCSDQATAYEVFEYEGVDDPAWMWDVLAQPSFRKVPNENLNAMFQRFEPVRYQKDEVVIRQGEAGDYYYLIRDGKVSITQRALPDGSLPEDHGMEGNAGKEALPTGQKQNAPIAMSTEEGVVYYLIPEEKPAGFTNASAEELFCGERNKGDGFGEDALISGKPRNATVTMLTDGLLMRLSKKDFDELLSVPLVKKVDKKVAIDLLRGEYVPLDVRLEDEFRAGTIRGSINMPLYLLRLKAKELDSEKKYMLFCQNGQRSSVAGFLLTQRGFDVCVLDGGLGTLANGY